MTTPHGDTPLQADEVITMGRLGVDIYPLQVGTSLRHVETFGKFLGGSAANVAVAAARLGRRTGLISRTGADPFGEFLHDALAGFGVDDRFVTPVPDLPTPVTFCEIFPPDDFPLYFYRRPTAPDLQIHPDELDLDAISGARVFWVTVTGLSEEPSREATLTALRARAGSAGRGGGGRTVLDLDYRPMFWASREEARKWVQEALPYVDVAVGNLDECDTAVGEREPYAAARALHDRGVPLAIVKQGPKGVLAHDGTTQVEVPPVPVEVVNGLGAGDAFGGALCHSLVSGWDLERSMRFCNAAGAIVAGRLACADAMPTVDEVEAKLAEAAGPQDSEAPVDDRRFRELVATRVARPEAVAEAAAARRRPTSLLGSHGRLMMIAADHPARGALAAGSRPFAMGDRVDLLDRLVLALSRPGVNGVLGTPDILEDLLLLGALDDKVVIGSMNRGGLAGTVFELDDRFTGYDAQAIADAGFEGGKMLTRIDPDDPATIATLKASADAISDLARHRLLAMIEPFLSHRVDGRVRNELTADAMVRVNAVAAGLGTTSAYTWLKVPIVDEMERAMAATTLPALILGGEVAEDQQAAFATWQKALALPTVQGLVIGRSLLYPRGDDVATAVDTAVGLL